MKHTYSWAATSRSSQKRQPRRTVKGATAIHGISVNSRAIEFIPFRPLPKEQFIFGERTGKAYERWMVQAVCSAFRVPVHLVMRGM